jgi:hypothetical protein
VDPLLLPYRFQQSLRQQHRDQKTGIVRRLAAEDLAEGHAGDGLILRPGLDGFLDVRQGYPLDGEEAPAVVAGDLEVNIALWINADLV